MDLEQRCLAENLRAVGEPALDILGPQIPELP